jgi:hypothetical protein
VLVWPGEVVRLVGEYEGESCLCFFDECLLSLVDFGWEAGLGIEMQLGEAILRDDCMLLLRANAVAERRKSERATDRKVFSRISLARVRRAV